jgi:L-threonylcarbamoyladenylate synthase
VIAREKCEESTQFCGSAPINHTTMPQPQILPIGPNDPSSAIRAAARALEEGKLVVLPTDTVYGVAAHWQCAAAQDQLYRIKQRDSGKPIPLLAADIQDIEKHGAVFSDVERRLAEHFWPGPMTLLLRTGNCVEGFRVPDHDIVRSVLRQAGGLLRVTSANLSGHPPALTAMEAVESIGESVSIVLDAGPAPGGIASTVVRVDNGKIVILRQGPISEEELNIGH